jgi:N-acylneuraminate cytidylyltransferase
LDNGRADRWNGLAVGIIPARGGSKTVPRKNLKLLGGLPLIAHSIISAKAAHELDRLIVSTDDPEIADAARAAGAPDDYVQALRERPCRPLDED